VGEVPWKHAINIKIFTRSESKLISFLRYSKCRKTLYKIDENFKREEVLDIFLGGGGRKEVRSC